jgi:parvulin-like peptidyl-prolyl isomerase
MTWRRRLSRAWIAVVLAVSGCMAGPSLTPALPPDTAAPRSTTAAGPAPAREESADVARSQKPEGGTAGPTSPICLISLPVDRPAEATHAHPAVIIRAVVNGEPIFDEEVQIVAMSELAANPSQADHDKILREALEQLIDREVLLQDALSRLERAGPQGQKMLQKLREVGDQEFEKRWLKPMMKAKKIDSQEEFAASMRQHNLSLEAMRRWWTRNFMAREYVLSRIEPHITRIGHLEIADYYATHSEEFTQPDSVTWKDIFIDATQHASRAAAREFAESLARRVHQGEDIAKLSWEFDNGTSGRFRKGDGQGRKRGEIFPREAEPVLFRIKEGDVEVVERGRGYHVIQLVKRQVAGPIPFNETVQKDIHNKLRMAVYTQERERILKELKRKAVIDPPVRSAANQKP